MPVIFAEHREHLSSQYDNDGPMFNALLVLSECLQILPPTQLIPANIKIVTNA